METKYFTGPFKEGAHHFARTLLVTSGMLVLTSCGSVKQALNEATTKEQGADVQSAEQQAASLAEQQKQSDGASGQQDQAASPSEEQEPVTGEAQQQEQDTAEQASDQAEQTVSLSDEELQEFTELFNTEEYNGFLTESYKSVDAINWDAVADHGAGIVQQEVGEKETADYLEFVGDDELYGTLFAIRKGDLAEYVKKHTGLDNIPEDILSWGYFPEYDSYYKVYWSSAQNNYTCTSGEKTGDHYELRFRMNTEEFSGAGGGKHHGRWADRVLTLNKSGDDVLVESNAIQWDDYADAEQTFDVELPQYDSPVRFITYTEDPNQVDVTLIKDGNHLEDLITGIYSMDGTTYLDKIDAVSFFDFNGDGLKDIAIIGEAGADTYAVLYDAVPTPEDFTYFFSLDKDKMAELGGDFTIGGLKTALLGDNQEGAYGSYKELYAQIAKVYYLSNEEYKYDLVYVDDDDIPELVVDEPGYQMSVFTYEDGHAHCLMHQWAYGAGGNGGYSYFPRTGVYYNGNSDYAGAIYFESYMSKHGPGEITTDYVARHINFNDLDGNGYPSEDELEASGVDEYEGSTSYSSPIDKNMTEEEIKAVIESYEKIGAVSLTGELEYSSLLEQLK